MYIGKTETVISMNLKMLRESVKVFQWYWMLGYFCGLGEWECFHGLCKVWVFQWTGLFGVFLQTGWFGVIH